MKEKTLALPCLRSVIGDWVYYSSVMTSKQLQDWVLPVKNIREAKALDDQLQRDLKGKRIDEIASYLLNDKSRFFNSIILGVFDGVPDWVEFSFPKELEEKIENKQLKQISETLGLMTFVEGIKIFAIDGQHRVEGIKEALRLDNDKVLADDQYSVIIIGHNDDKLGKKRSRKLFSDINKNAKAVVRNDRIIIDEQDISAIVARRVFAENKYFNGGKLIALSETSNLDKDDTVHFTNIEAVYKVNKYLKALIKIPKDKNEWDEEVVKMFKCVVFDFYDFIFEFVDDYKKFFITKSISIKQLRENNKYLLFRPIGLFLITRLYVYFNRKDKLEVFKNSINEISFIFPNSPYNNILWNKGKMEATTKNQTLAYRLSLYLFDEIKFSDLENLLESYRSIAKNEELFLPEVIINNKENEEKIIVESNKLVDKISEDIENKRRDKIIINMAKIERIENLIWGYSTDKMQEMKKNVEKLRQKIIKL